MNKNVEKYIIIVNINLTLTIRLLLIFAANQLKSIIKKAIYEEAFTSFIIIGRFYVP